MKSNTTQSVVRFVVIRTTPDEKGDSEICAIVDLAKVDLISISQNGDENEDSLDLTLCNGQQLGLCYWDSKDPVEVAQKEKLLSRLGEFWALYRQAEADKEDGASLRFDTPTLYG